MFTDETEFNSLFIKDTDKLVCPVNYFGHINALMVKINLEHFMTTGK